MGIEQTLLQQLSIFQDSATVILGIGNTLKGDDGAGPLVCQKLKEVEICADVIDAGTVPENYIQRIIGKTPQNLLVIDAIDYGDTPGTIRLFKPDQLSSHAISTHSLSPRLFVDMICQNINVDVYFVGIQPARVQFGQPVSPQVERAIEEVSHLIAETFPPASA